MSYTRLPLKMAIQVIRSVPGSLQRESRLDVSSIHHLVRNADCVCLLASPGRWKGIGGGEASTRESNREEGLSCLISDTEPHARDSICTRHNTPHHWARHTYTTLLLARPTPRAHYQRCSPHIHVALTLARTSELLAIKG